MDRFICGICNEEMDNVLTFLQHKVNHVGPGVPAGCDLCRLSYTRQNTLRDHYKKKHRVNIQVRNRPIRISLQNLPRPNPVKCANQEDGHPANDSEDPNTTRIASCVETSQTKSEDDSPEVLSTDILLNDIDGEIENSSVGNVRNIYIHVEPALSQEEINNDVEESEKQDGKIKQSGNIAEAAMEDFLNTPENENLPHKDITDLSQCLEDFHRFSSVDGESALTPCTKDQDISGNLENHDSAMETEISSDGSENFKENSIPKHSELSMGSTDVCNFTPDAVQETQEGDYFFIFYMEEKEGQSIGYGKMMLKCLHCSYVTDFKASLSRHMKKEHPDMINLHSKIKIVMHGNEKDFKDQKVMKMSEYNAIQASERRKKNGKKIRGVETQDLVGNYTCGICSKVFNRLRYLRKHVLTHQNNQQFLCDECGKSFKTKTYLTAHRKTHKKEAFHCRQCDFVSTVALAIHTHRQIHTEGSVICDICGTAYSDKSTLLKHKQVHDISRPYACDFPGCTFRFKTELRCNAHIKNHSNTQGQFKCHKCNYVFRYKHHLKRHEAKKHGLITSGVEKSKDGDQEDSLKSLVIEEIHEIDSVNLIVDHEINRDQFNLQSALQNSSLVIATDEEGNAVNYEVADISMNVQYQTLMSGTDLACQADGHSMLMPQSDSVIVTGDQSDSIGHSSHVIETEVCSSTVVE
eukprot:XP_011424917.1 PREDICTED: zinc finger protein 490 [Crassostrea gigas]